jgi:hypothetical protein
LECPILLDPSQSGHSNCPRGKITKEEADAVAAEGSAYLIGYFDADGKLLRVVKMLRIPLFLKML